MCKMQLALIAVLATVSVSGADGGGADRVARAVQPSGKCDTYRIEPKPIDYKKVRVRVLLIL